MFFLFLKRCGFLYKITKDFKRVFQTPMAKVCEFFDRQGVGSRLIALELSSAPPELAAAALHCAPQRIAKTLSFLLDIGPLLIVAAGDTRIDNAKYKARLGAKTKMLPLAEVEQIIGHAVGGVCPFAVNSGVKVYLNCSLQRFKTVFPVCGSANNAIEKTIPELEKYSGAADRLDICKDWHC